MDEPAGNGTSKRVVLLVTTIGSFIFPFLLSAVNVALPPLAKELSLDAVTLGWMNAAYILSLATFSVPLGRIADIYGRKKILSYGIIILTPASFFAGMTNSAAIIILCRVFQGISGAMFIGTAVALLISVFPANEWGKVLGINRSAVYTGVALGSLLSGVLTQHLGWRSIFFLSAFLGLVVTGIILWKLRGEWTGAKGEKFDFAGSAIYSLALVALIYGLSLLPAMSGVLLIVGGVIGLSAFIRWEMRTGSPVLDISLFRNNRVFTFSNLVHLVTYSAIFAVQFLISLYLQYLKGFNPQTAGLILVAMPVMQAIFSPLAGRLSDRIEPRIIVSTGLVLITAGLIVFTFLNEQTPLKSIIGNLILIGFGYSLFSAPNLNAVMTAAPKTASGAASAIVGTARTLGMALSMGVAMLMFALYMGRVEITPEYYPLLQESMRMSFITFAVLCFGGTFASLARGKVR
jgi:EmrB/QacA subfamily drug resistance transporter